MSRFRNLEFEGPEKRPEQSTQAGLKDAGFYYEEALRQFEAGRFESALRNYAKVLEHNSRHSAAWLGQVQSLIELGESKEARLWADKALEVFPRDPDLLASKAVALARSGDYQGAISYSDASMEVKGNTPFVWLSRGDVLLSRDEKKAEYCFDKGLAGQNWFQHWMAARTHLFYRQFARALKYAQQALSMDGSRAVVWLDLARAQGGLGLISQATQSLEQARQLDPESALPDRLLAELPGQGLILRLLDRARQFFK
ncbi:MAG: tetratricopeptide repeat protein [Verrucomicrobiota bacterium]|nr:tetratricopeptide repeat protein [Verrucomicrobiota bacterium]